MKKGFIFSLEALIAMSILTSLLAFLFVFNIEDVSPYKRFERAQLYTKDSLEVMSQITVKDVIDQVPPDKIRTLIQQMEDGKIQNETTIIEAIGILWSEDDDTARNISNETLSLILPKNLGYSLTADGDEIYSFSSPVFASTEVSKSNKIVSGFEPNQTTKGYVAWAQLQKIASKTFSSYIYLGGFVGQGNLSLIMRDIPADANISSMYMELNAGSDFDLYINGNFCDNFHKSAGSFPVDKWNITDSKCLNNITKGSDNRFGFNFTASGINDKFIGGGFIKVVYETAQLTPSTGNVMKNYFPGIDGIINLYDSFYLPGTLSGATVHLHYYNNISGFDSFLTIGGKEIYRNNVTGEQNVNIPYADIWQEFGSEQNLVNNVSNRTVPLRIGTEGLEIYKSVAIADAVLITDVSGSMNTCDVNSSLFSDCSSAAGVQNRRIDVAKNVSKVFVDTVLNSSGNRVGLIAYTATPAIRFWHDLSNNTVSLKNQIDSYTSEDCTCISCGIATSTQILLGNSTPSRFRGMVVMSDGEANTLIGTNPWIGGSGCSGGSAAKTEAINRACEARNNNLTLFSIAFGKEADKTTLKKIACWNCASNNWIGNVTLPNGTQADCIAVRYAESNNFEELKSIYKEFAQSFIGLGYTTQKVNITGNVPLGNIIYNDSYIEFSYEPEAPAYGFGEIALKLETDSFNLDRGCNGTFFVPEQLRVNEIRLTSYSSDFWTKYLFVNNSENNWKKVYNLDLFGDQYADLGDPFNIQFPAKFIKSNESNNIGLILGISPTNYTDSCSLDNRAIYTAAFRAITFSDVLPNSTGNIFRVYFNRGDFNCTPEGYVDVTVGTPADSNVHNVTDLNTTHNAVHSAFSQLLNKLNFKGDLCGSYPSGSSNNPIDIEITEDLNITTSEKGNVPSLWGPIKFELTISS